MLPILPIQQKAEKKLEVLLMSNPGQPPIRLFP